MAFPTGTHDDQVDCLVDLVIQEVVPGGNFLAPMDVTNLPLNGQTYTEDLQANPPKEGESFMDMMFREGLTYRGMPKSEINQSWQQQLLTESF